MLRYIRRLWEVHLLGYERRTRLEPSAMLPCEWCHEVKPTTLGAIWSLADPKGRLVRLCEECTSCCAGG